MVLMMKQNSNEQVIELLLSARLRDTTRIKTEIYKHFSEIIELFTRAYNINAPKLIIDYSLNRRTEHIKISGESFIIYDQSLGQSLNHLNTIVALESQDTSDRNFALDVYASKILAQEFRLRNMKDISLLFGLLYDLGKQDARRVLLSSTLSSMKRFYYTAIQEIYVLCHELSHIVLDINKDFKDGLLFENKKFYPDR